MINKRLICNPEGFSASHTTAGEGKKQRREQDSHSRRETRDDWGEVGWERHGSRWGVK